MGVEIISSTTNLVFKAIRHTIRFIQEPVVSGLFGMAVLLDACSLGEDSTVGGTIAILPGSTVCNRRSNDASAYIVEGELGAELVPVSCWEPYPDEEDLIGGVSCYPWRSYSGFWAMTQETRNATLRVNTFKRSLTLAEQRRIHQQFADLIQEYDWNLDAEYVAILRSGGGLLRRTLWSGYRHNVVAAFLVTAFLCSIGWVPKRIATRRRDQAMSSGLCPECRYDLQGLAENGCPECGWQREAVP